jgi:Ca-activated chloride channel family protein
LTDGFIGDEASVMATIRRHRRGARIFSFGVGASVNRWLLVEMAVAGQGVSRVVGLEDDPAAVAEDLAKRLATPLLSDAWIDWGQLAMTDATPAGVFDLFAGALVRIFGRAPRGLRADQIGATLVATADGREVRIPIAARRLEGEQGAAAIPVLWARGQIAERMRALTDPARAHESATAERELLVQEITTLGLQYGLTTRWTSFVAVSEHAPQPVASTAPSLSFGGSSTPEPATWAALAALAVQAARVMRRRRA